jgi:hypothetical protein
MDRLGRIRVPAAFLAGTLLLVSCQHADNSPTETVGKEEMTMEITNHVDTSAYVCTEPVSEPETEAVLDHDGLMALLDYNEAEKAILAETAERMSGLRITYYADKAATQAVRSDVLKSTELTVSAEDGICAVILEGFITFGKDGAYTLVFDGASDGDSVAIIEGEHHVRAGRKVRVKARAGTQYGLKLKASRDNGGEDWSLSFLCNNGGEGFSLTVGRVLLEHEPVTVTPAMDIPMRDTFVYAAPDGYYYMTGTSGPDFWDNNYVIHIYRSADLSEWEDLGVVWDWREHATWAKHISKEDRVPVWAPELCYVNGNWYMTYTMGFWDAMSCGILVSTTGRPEGPYTDTAANRLVDNLDGSLFVEDDGTVYFLYKDGMIAPLNEDLSGFAGEFKSLYAADGLPVGFEGCSILKHNGKYYLTAATYNQSYDQNGRLVTTYDSMIAVSDELMGPYSETRLLMRNGGHNNLFVDRDGRVWTTLFAPSGNLGFNCKPTIVPLTEDERGILTVK